MQSGRALSVRGRFMIPLPPAGCCRRPRARRGSRPHENPRRCSAATALSISLRSDTSPCRRLSSRGAKLFPVSRKRLHRRLGRFPVHAAARQLLPDAHGSIAPALVAAHHAFRVGRVVQQAALGEPREGIFHRILAVALFQQLVPQQLCAQRAGRKAVLPPRPVLRGIVPHALFVIQVVEIVRIDRDRLGRAHLGCSGLGLPAQPVRLPPPWLRSPDVPCGALPRPCP